MLTTDNDNSGDEVQSNLYPPSGLESSPIAADWKETDKSFYFHGHPISPYLIYQLEGGDFDLSDGSTTMAVDIEAGSASKQFRDKVNTNGTGFRRAEYDALMQDSSKSEFNYEYLGKTKNGVHVIRTSSWGGGSGIFSNFLFVRFIIRKGFDDSGANKDQLLMCLEKDYVGGDRNETIVQIKENTVVLKIVDRVKDDAAIPDTTLHLIQF